MADPVKERSPVSEEPQEGEKQPTAEGEASLIPFLTQAFNTLFTKLSDMSKELDMIKAKISQIDQINQQRLEAVETKFEEILSHLREQRRSSITHYSQLAATIAQEFEVLGSLRSAAADKRTLELLNSTLQALQDTLFCLRTERLIRRLMTLQDKVAPR